MELEIKNLIEDSNKLVEALRTEVSEIKNADGLDAEKIGKMESDLASALEAKNDLTTRLAALETSAARPGLAGKSGEADEYKAAFMEYLRNPTDSKAESLNDMAKKSINITTASAGGVAVPSSMGSEIIRTITDISPMRQLSRVVSVSTTEYKEIVGGTAATGWATESGARANTASPTFSSIAPEFGAVYANVPVTRFAVEDIFFNVEAYVQEEVAIQMAKTENAAFITGDGSNKPIGLLANTAIWDGVTSEAANTTLEDTVILDDLIKLKYDLQAAYRQNAEFLMNTNTLSKLATIKDTTGNYIWRQTVIAGEPDQLLGHNVYVAEEMPDVASGETPVFFGDLSQAYLVADRAGLTVIIDPYTVKGQLLMYFERRVGGCPRNVAAGRLLTIA